MTSIFRRKGRKGWTLKYRTVDGAWRMEAHATRAGAEARALELHQAPESGRRVLFREHAVRWLSRAQQQVRPGTHTVYLSMATAHFLPAFGHMPLREITRARVKDFLAEKLRAGLARKYVAAMRSALHTCLEDAREDGLLVINPATKLRRREAQEQPAPPKAMDADQLRRFLAAAQSVAPRQRLIFRTMALTGMRPGEALALRWEDVDLAARVVHVRRGFTRGALQRTKSSRERDVDLAAVLVEELHHHAAQQQAAALQAGTERPPWVFPSPRSAGRPTDHTTTQAACRAALKAAGLPQHYTPHCLRHTFASLLLTRGRSIYYVQRMLGHASIKQTVDTYGSWLPAGNPSIVDDLAAVVDDPAASVTTDVTVEARGARVVS